MKLSGNTIFITGGDLVSDADSPRPFTSWATRSL
jgi:hypothetical protein